MTGQGLESLIPKKSPSPHQPAPHPVQGGSVPPARPFHPQQNPHAHPVSKETPFVMPMDPGHREPYRPPMGGAFHASEKPPQKQPESVFQIEVEKIRPNPYQPRHEFNPEALQELSQSIREFGIIQPLVVTKIVKEADSGTQVEYQLIAGERRLKAAKMAGLPRVPAIVKHVELPRVKLELALIENIQRSNLNPLESAKAYARLQDEFNITQREIAAKVGKSREAVANTLRLLNLPSIMQDALSEGRINESQARTLLSIENPEEQRLAFTRIMEGKVSVRAMRESAAPKKDIPPPVASATDPEAQYWEKRMEEQLGARVRILRQGSQGKIVIPFYSEEEKRGLFEKLGGPQEM